MKDYYAILQLDKTCSKDDIRRQYRKLAMRWHPDRNPDNPQAEEKFKEIAEAYGVLTDPKKRAEYDAHRAGGFAGFGTRGAGSSAGSTSGADSTRFDQQEIFRDLFNDPNFQRMFASILGDFQKAGYRSSERFVKESFFTDKKGALKAGASLVAAIAVPAIKSAAKSGLRAGGAKLKQLGVTLKQRLGERFPAVGKMIAEQGDHSSLDITYHTPLSREEMRHGKTIQVQVQKEDGSGTSETLRVRIPAGSLAGQRLRIPGRGHFGGFNRMSRGDLYLCLVEE